MTRTRPLAAVWRDGCCAAAFDRFNRGFEWLSNAYGSADPAAGARAWRSSW